MGGKTGASRGSQRRARPPAPGQAPLSGQPHSQHADSNINGCRWARRAPGRVGPTVVAASARRPRAGLASGVDVAPPRALGKALRATDGSGCADRWARRAGRGPRCRLRQLEGRGKDEGAPGPSKCPFCSALLGKKNSFRGSWAEAWQSGDRSPCQLPCPCRACAGPSSPPDPRAESLAWHAHALRGTPQCAQGHLVSPRGGGQQSPHRSRVHLAAPSTGIVVVGTGVPPVL